ncbi:MAG: hypothetical protein ACR2MS_06870 [Weeksellaceae bacterium]
MVGRCFLLFISIVIVGCNSQKLDLEIKEIEPITEHEYELSFKVQSNSKFKIFLDTCYTYRDVDSAIIERKFRPKVNYYNKNKKIIEKSLMLYDYRLEFRDKLYITAPTNCLGEFTVGKHPQIIKIPIKLIEDFRYYNTYRQEVFLEEELDSIKFLNICLPIGDDMYECSELYAWTP